MPEKPVPAPPDKPEDGGNLDEFMEAVISFAASIGKAAAKVGGDGDESAIIGHNAGLVKRNFEQVRRFTKENFTRLNAQDRMALGEFLTMTDATEMARSGERLAVQRLSAGKIGKGILVWISKYLTELKKLIGWILGLFNGGKPPKWWSKIEQLIDELWNMLVELLGMIFGFDASQLARELSQGEVNYLNEQAAVARLQNEYDRIGKSDED